MVPPEIMKGDMTVNSIKSAIHTVIPLITLAM